MNPTNKKPGINKILAFAHIPKTAGTMLNHILYRYFGASLLQARLPRSSVGTVYLPEYMKRDMKLYPGCRCISSHALRPYIDFGAIDERLLWMTFLRDPFKRFVSHYVHQFTRNIPKYKLDFVDWANKFDRADFMVRMIAGEKNIDKAIEIVETKFSFIGLTEKLSTSLELISSKFNLPGIETDISSQRRMVTKDASIKENIFSNWDEYEHILNENNRLDKELYDYVVENIWPRQLQTTKNGLQPESKDLVNGDWNHLKFRFKNYLIYLPYTKLG